MRCIQRLATYHFIMTQILKIRTVVFIHCDSQHNHNLGKEMAAEANNFKITEIPKLIYNNFLSLSYIALFVLLFMITYLATTSPIYRSQMVLAPASEQEMNQAGGLNSLLAGIGGKSGSSINFFLYQEMVFSHRVSDLLAKDEKIMTTLFSKYWDVSQQKWLPVKTLKNRLENIFGLYQEYYPTGKMIQKELENNLILKETKGGAYITLSYDHKDAQFAKYIIDKVHLTTDNLIKEEAVIKQQYLLTFLQKKMDESVMAIQKEALADMFALELRKQILLSSSLPYSAKVIDPSYVPERYQSPNIIKAFVISAFMYLLLSTSFLSYKFNSTINNKD